MIIHCRLTRSMASTVPLAIPDGASVKEIDEKDFPTKEQHQEFKGWTALAAACDQPNFMDRSRGQSLLTLTSQQEKGTHRVLFEYLQTSIINILPRLHEIIACIPGATRAIPPTVQDELTVLCEAKVVIAQNPERSEHKDAEVEHPYKVFFQANIPTNNLPASEEPKDTIKFPWSRFNPLCTPSFAQHTGVVAGLLKRVHSSTSDDELAKASAQLTSYVFMVSHPKMMARMKLCTAKKTRPRSFYDVMSTAPDDLLHEQAWEVDDRPMSQPFLFKVPNEGQRQIIEDFFDGDSEHAAASGEAVWGPRGRRRFHAMLSTYLRNVHGALSALTKAMGFSKTAKIPTDADFVDKVADLLATAIYAVTYLTLFYQRFDAPDGSVLYMHLQWLEKMLPIDGKSTPFVSPRKQDATGTDSVPVTPQAPTSEPLGISPVVQPSSRLDDDEDDIDADHDEADELEDIGARVATVSLGNVAPTEFEQAGWAAAAKKSLDLICLHDWSIVQLTTFEAVNKTRREEKISERIDEAVIAVVEVRQGKLDEQQKRASYEECIKKIEGRLHTDMQKAIEAEGDGAEYSKEDVSKTLERFINAPSETRRGQAFDITTEWITHYFGGTYHAETILMALWACAKDPSIAQGMTQEWLNCNNIFAVKADLFKMLETPLAIIPVSKRCCLSCWKFCEVLSGSEDFPEAQKLIMLGYHTTSSASALPPFVPVDMAKQCIEHAENRAYEKVLQFLKRERLVEMPTKSSSSDPERSTPSKRAAPASRASLPKSKRRKLDVGTPSPS
ncbi:hypothetical protein CLAFUR4_13450 [Fulvia fulva]|nr:hypothetical protein CLAFUR4_13450 [Fulvia fulva]KAK4612951.1 hypothetical protein CLAFUR0_13458 [Fulvia fulva]WPV36225.1 hypothetical protein CLAFUW7_13454 [Fulvia fulva]